MQVNRLNKEELTYELRVRGIAPGTVEEMRRRLAMARRLEMAGDSVKYPDYPYTPEEDVEAVTKSLKELQPLIDQFSESASSNNFHTYQSKLSHLLHRLEHLNEEQAIERPTLLANTLTLLDELHRKAEEFTKAQNLPTPLSDKKGLSLSAFLERVEELRVADMFPSKLSWSPESTYSPVEPTSFTWPTAVKEIRNRTQGPEESIGIYLAVMSGYFNRLSCALSEETKLKILLRNIAPFYQNQLALVDVASIAQLRELGRRLEARKEAVENYAVPKRGPSLWNQTWPTWKRVVSQPRMLTAWPRPPLERNRMLPVPGKYSAIDVINRATEPAIVVSAVANFAIAAKRTGLRQDRDGSVGLGCIANTHRWSGLSLVEEIGLHVSYSQTSSCTVANGSRIACTGVVELPITLRGQFRLIKALVVPELAHILILGVDFWRAMGLVPDLRHNEWQFSSEPITVNSVQHVSGQTHLTSLEGTTASGRRQECAVDGGTIGLYGSGRARYRDQ
ncbi:hypothetical protein NQ315_010461 [Exocentrus adspersus]|uniref:Uncharacterized protein n=1 Tax=Exocentrus adspersus TaxID=1586481 RepID=A0AAV8V529_9CUCU|nr:hypothetical protein NQ315_010461 [Exocentrus adspersus]